MNSLVIADGTSGMKSFGTFGISNAESTGDTQEGDGFHG